MRRGDKDGLLRMAVYTDAVQRVQLTADGKNNIHGVMPEHIKQRFRDRQTDFHIHLGIPHAIPLDHIQQQGTHDRFHAADPNGSLDIRRVMLLDA